jgi:hypothetical protein
MGTMGRRERLGKHIQGMCGFETPVGWIYATEDRLVEAQAIFWQCNIPTMPLKRVREMVDKFNGIDHSVSKSIERHKKKQKKKTRDSRGRF